MRFFKENLNGIAAYSPDTCSTLPRVLLNALWRFPKRQSVFRVSFGQKDEWAEESFLQAKL